MASVPAHMDGGDPVRLALENDLETHFETSIGVTLSCLAPPFLGLTHRPGACRQRSSVETNVSQGDGGGGGAGRVHPTGHRPASRTTSEKDTRSQDSARRGRQKAACGVTAVSQDKVSLGGLVPHVSSSQSRRGEPHRRPAFGVAPPRWGHTRGTPCLLALCSRLMAPRRKAAPGEGTENRQVGPGFPQGCREGVC